MIKVFFFLILFSNHFLSQEKYNMVVEYNLSISTQTIKGFLVANNKKSYFILSHKLEQSYDELLIDTNKKINPYFLYYYNQDTKHFYQTLSSFATQTLGGSVGKMSIEDFGNLSWKIENEEKKQYLGYNCIKATADFRGRKYLVWFTPEISNNSFPWKLKGLPGVILSFEDSEGFFKGEAIKISLNKNYDIPKSIFDFFSNKSNEVLDYKEVIKLENIFLNEHRRKAIADLPKGTIFEEIPVRTSSLEKTFEWEEEPKKP